MEILTRDQLVTSFLYALCNRKLLMAMSFLAVLFMALFLGYLVTPSWTATTLLMVQANPRTRLAPFAEGVQSSPPTTAASYAQSLAMLMNGRAMAYEMVRTFGLDERKRQKAQEPANLRERLKMGLVKAMTFPIVILQSLGILQKPPVDWVDKAAEDFRSGFGAWTDIKVVEGTEVISLAIRGESPELATAVANTMARRAGEILVQLAAKASRTTYETYLAEQEEAEAKLAAAEAQLRQFKEANQGVSLPDAIRLKNEEFESVRQSRARAASEREVLARLLDDLERRPRGIAEELVSSPALAANAMIQDLKAALAAKQVRLAALLNEKTPDHPDVVNLRSEIAQQERELMKEIGHTLATMDVQITTLDKESRRLESELMKLPARELTLARLTSQVQLYQELFRGLQAKSEELRVASQSGLADASLMVLDEAYVSPLGEKDSPNWGIIILVGLFFATVVAVGTAFFVEYWRDPVKGRADLESCGIPVLGVVPRLKG
ncbi:MAG: hypothetical protein AB1634_15750 [Thermodesulfobacteriota bacterium]